MQTQRGMNIRPIIPFVLVGISFSYLFGFMGRFIPADSSVPYIFSPLFLVLIGAIWPLLKESSELKELDAITETERARLYDMVKSAQLSLAWSIALLFIFGFSSGSVTYLSSINIINMVWALRWIGFCIGVSLIILIYIIIMRLNVSSFKADVVSRMQTMKQQQKLLKRAAVKKTPIDSQDKKN